MYLCQAHLWVVANCGNCSAQDSGETKLGLEKGKIVRVKACACSALGLSPLFILRACTVQGVGATALQRAAFVFILLFSARLISSESLVEGGVGVCVCWMWGRGLASHQQLARVDLLVVPDCSTPASPGALWR